MIRQNWLSTVSGESLFVPVAGFMKMLDLLSMRRSHEGRP